MTTIHSKLPYQTAHKYYRPGALEDLVVIPRKRNIPETYEVVWIQEDRQASSTEQHAVSETLLLGAAVAARWSQLMQYP